VKDLAEPALRGPTPGRAAGRRGTRGHVLLAGVASVVAAGCAAAGVPGLRVPAGLALCLVLPGHLAVLALAPGAEEQLGRHTRLLLAVTLSLVATMAVGLATAATVGVAARPVAVGLGAVCVVATLAGLVRAEPGWPPAPPWPPLSRPAARWLAVLPPALAAAVFVGAVLRVAGGPAAGGGFTELSLEHRGAELDAVVTSRERALLGFRYEVLVDGRRARAGVLTLRPGERRRLPLPAADGHRLEVRLYQPGRAQPYRRVGLQPAPADGKRIRPGARAPRTTARGARRTVAG